MQMVWQSAKPGHLTRVLVGAAALALALAGPAAGSRKPTVGEIAKITDALYGKFGCDPYPDGTCKLVVRVATENQRWAAGYTEPTSGNGDIVQPDVASLFRSNHRRHVHQVGNGGGCHVPPAVVEDLHLFCA